MTDDYFVPATRPAYLTDGEQALGITLSDKNADTSAPPATDLGALTTPNQACFAGNAYCAAQAVAAWQEQNQ